MASVTQVLLCIKRQLSDRVTLLELISNCVRRQLAAVHDRSRLKLASEVHLKLSMVHYMARYQWHAINGSLSCIAANPPDHNWPLCAARLVEVAGGYQF